MTDNSKITLGNDRALFMFSRGYCYYPECPVKVFRKVNGNARLQVERAHIIAEELNGPRWTRLDPKVVNSAENLMLMCPAHHKEIDHNVDDFPVELLRTWKKEREGNLTMALDGLGELGEDGFKQVVATAMETAKTELLTAIEKGHGLSADVVQALQSLVNERLDSPGLEREDINLLFEAVARLSGMELSVVSSDLVKGAQLLDGFQGTMTQFSSAMSEDRFGQLRFHLNELETSVSRSEALEVPDVDPIERASTRLERARDGAAERAEELTEASLSTVVDQHRWKDYMRWGFIAGFCAALALAGGIWYLAANGGGAGG